MTCSGKSYFRVIPLRKMVDPSICWLWDDANMKKIIRVAQMFTQPLQRCFQHWFNSMNYYLVLFSHLFQERNPTIIDESKQLKKNNLLPLKNPSVNQMDFTALTGKTWSVSVMKCGHGESSNVAIYYPKQKPEGYNEF